MRRPRSWAWVVHGLIVCVCLAAASNAAARPTVAVVLGGGAARGFSHIGLLKAFEEEGIPIDILVGTSMGSIVAGLYAAGCSPAELEYMVQQVEISELFSPLVPPRGGVLDTAPFERFLAHLTGDARVEELEIPFYSVVTNLVTGESVALDRGPLSKAIVASMAIPGMFAPVEIDGEMYVDGGIKKPVPAAHARRAGADVVIAVDVRRELGEIDHGSILGNLQLALYFVLNANTKAQLEEADVVIAPEVQSASYMEYGRAADFIEEGYRAGRAAAPEIKALLLEKDPAVVFVPRRRDGAPGEEFRRRLAEALKAARAQSGTRGPDIWAGLSFETARAPALDVRLSLPLAEAEPQLAGFLEANRRLDGEKGIYTLGAGLRGDKLSGAVFLRYGGALYPGVRLESALGKEKGARLRLLGEWTRPSPGKGAVSLDGAVEWRFPLRERNVWELALAESAAYVAAGAALGGEAGAAWEGPRYRVEAGFQFDLRLFGIYPVRWRLALQYRGGESPWLLRLSLGE